MNLFYFSQELNEGMRISRGGFSKRTHCIATPSKLNYTDVPISALCDVICDLKFLSANFNFYNALLSSADYASPAISSYESACRDITYPNKDSCLMSLLCSLSTASQMHNGAYQVDVDSLDSISNNCYASNLYWIEDISLMVDKSLAVLADGVNNVKHHVGVSDPINEALRCNHILRQCLEVFPSSKHSFDLNCAYSFSDACLFVDNLDRAFFDSILWIEEPLNFSEYLLLPAFQEYSCYPIAAGENAFSTLELKFLAKSIAYTMPDLGRNCDLVSLPSILNTAQDFSNKVTLHNYGSVSLFQKTLTAYCLYPELAFLEVDFSRNPLFNSYRDQHASVSEWLRNILSLTTLSCPLPWVENSL